MLTVEPAGLLDYKLLNEIELRDIDKLEISGLSYAPPHQVLLQSFLLSTARYIAKRDGRPVGALGFVLAGNTLVPWVLGSDDMTAEPKAFWRLSKEIFSKWQALGLHMMNLILRDNTESISWLEHLGFTAHRDEPVVCLRKDLEYISFTYTPQVV